MYHQKVRDKVKKQAINRAVNKLALEKTIRVDGKTFEQCIGDFPEHHQNIHRNRGFLRTYDKSFFVPNKDGFGQTYCHGIIYIINRDAEVNKTYSLSVHDIDSFIYSVKVLKHRIVDIQGMRFTLSKQRYKFDD